MAVQEFMVDEVKELSENDEKGAEWSALVEKLGLEGQRTLCNGSPQSPIPFPHMNKEMIKVYETLCPMKSLIKDYNKTAIPIRVLEIAGLCVLKEYFGKIEIWYDDKAPDPVVVGCDGEDKYILARWAAELEEYAVLREKAIKRKVAKMKTEYEKNLRETEMALQTLNSIVESWLSGDWTHVANETW